MVSSIFFLDHCEHSISSSFSQLSSLECILQPSEPFYYYHHVATEALFSTSFYQFCKFLLFNLKKRNKRLFLPGLRELWAFSYTTAKPYYVLVAWSHRSRSIFTSIINENIKALARRNKHSSLLWATDVLGFCKSTCHNKEQSGKKSQLKGEVACCLIINDNMVKENKRKCVYNRIITQIEWMSLMHSK